MVADKLFAVCLGGRAPKGNTELHDVVFVAGASLEDTYPQLLDLWFGLPKGLHIDSWMELDVVDGHRVALVEKGGVEATAAGGKRLYFVNLGAYQDGVFAEIHANKFIVAVSAPEAKARAKRELLAGWPSPVHTDDLYAVDDCIALGKVGAFHIVLTETGEAGSPQPHNGYHILPKDLVAAYARRVGA